MSTIGDLLRFDPLAEAERITGNEYKDDAETTHVGMALAMLNGEAKDRALTETDDTRWSLDFAGTVALWKRLGFAVVYERPFKGSDETFLVLWHPDGILGTIESYHGDRVNTQKVYYNVRPVGTEYLPWGVISSGRYTDGVWVGDHDAREGLRFNLDQLRAHGDFLPVWVERPFLWLLTYEDSKVDGYDYKAINADIIEQFPENVRSAIAGEARS